MAAQHPPRVATRSLHADHIEGSGSVPGQNGRREAFHRGGVQLNCVSVFLRFSSTELSIHMCFCLCFCFCVHEQMKLEKIVVVKLCRSIVYEALQGVHTPKRPSSPAELYITEEQEFLSKNPMVTATGGSRFLSVSWVIGKVIVRVRVSVAYKEQSYRIFHFCFTCLRNISFIIQGGPVLLIIDISCSCLILFETSPSVWGDMRLMEPFILLFFLPFYWL